MKDKELDIAYFLSFCIELYGKKYQLSGDEVAVSYTHLTLPTKLEV